jgi:endoplasmic reticulum-Golgi intermediate compartment protein 2
VYIADDFGGRKVIETNQYAVTEQSHPSAGHMGQEVPGISCVTSALTQGIFFKYDVEPLQLTIWHGHLSTYRFLMRLIALIGGVAMCFEWGYKVFDALSSRFEKRANGRRVSSGDGLLNGLLEKEG